MTYIESYNNYLTTTESQVDHVEDIIADALGKHNWEPKDNFNYCSFVENVKLKLYNVETSLQELYKLCHTALVENNIENYHLNILKTELVGKVEYTIKVEL